MYELCGQVLHLANLVASHSLADDLFSHQAVDLNLIRQLVKLGQNGTVELWLLSIVRKP